MKQRSVVIAGVIVGLGLLVVVSMREAPENKETSFDESSNQALLGSDPEVDALRAEIRAATAANRRLLERIHDLESARAREADSDTQQEIGASEPKGSEPPRPLPFPRDVREAYRPEVFEGIVSRVEKECELGLQVVTTECSSYPCVAVFRTVEPIAGPMSLETCSPWKEAFPNGESLWGAVSEETMSDGSRVSYYAWIPTPEDRSQMRVANEVARERIRKMLGELGVEMTW